MEELDKILVRISEEHDVITIRRKIRELAKSIGFMSNNVEELAIVVSELAQNLLDHNAINGRIIISRIISGNKKGLQVESVDDGPGIANIEAVMEDGYSSRNTLGIGLGAVRRLMGEFDISSKTEHQTRTKKGYGTRIITRKYIPIKDKEEAYRKNFTHFSVFSRSKFGEIKNGDKFIIKKNEDETIIAVIDGLGHGLEASIASDTALQYLMENFKKNLRDLVESLHLVLKKTRGAVISIAKINDKEGYLHYVGIGNVITRIYHSKTPIRPINYNGTLGVALRKFKTFKYDWKVGNIIIMVSDGISSSMTFNDDPNLLNKHPMTIAKYILLKYGKTHDDATILVGGPI